MGLEDSRIHESARTKAYLSSRTQRQAAGTRQFQQSVLRSSRDCEIGKPKSRNKGKLTDLVSVDTHSLVSNSVFHAGDEKGLAEGRSETWDDIMPSSEGGHACVDLSCVHESAMSYCECMNKKHTSMMILSAMCAISGAMPTAPPNTMPVCKHRINQEGSGMRFGR